MNKYLYKAVVVTMAALMLAGCSWSKKDKEPEQAPLTDYRESRTRSPLEIPPDLSAESSETSLSVPVYKPRQTAVSQPTAVATPATPVEQETTAANVSAGKPVMYIERAGSQRWLVIAQPVGVSWSDARDFILSSGLSLEREDRNAGTMETGWAVNYAEGVLRGTQRLLNKYMGSLYTTPSRDKFIVRVEPGRVKGTSEVYFSHRGMIEKAVIDNNVDPVRTIWEPVPPDPNIEAEMLSRFMIDLGATSSEASSKLERAEQAEDQATIVKSAANQQALMVNDKLDLAWRRVGQTLDRVGFTVEDRDRAQNAYFVRYADPEMENKKPGFFSKLFGGKSKIPADNSYRILLTEEGEQTRVDVRTRDGSKADDNVVKEIITLLYEQLR